MTKEELEFTQQGLALMSADKMADLAIMLFGDDAGSVLLGAAMSAWKRQMGDDHALNLAKISLQTIVNGIEGPSQMN